jgi:hypothetical protein
MARTSLARNDQLLDRAMLWRVLLMASVATLPEIAVTLSALRLRALDMAIEKWLGLFEQLSPNDKWSPGGLQQCRVVHGGARRLRRTGRRGGQLGAHQ